MKQKKPPEGGFSLVIFLQLVSFCGVRTGDARYLNPLSLRYPVSCALATISLGASSGLSNGNNLDLSMIFSLNASLVDERGVASSGTVSVVDLQTAAEAAQITTGVHPCDLELSADGLTLYVANDNSDAVSAIDTRGLAVKEHIPVRPDPDLAFGSAPNALALSKDGRKLFVANGGNNAVAVISLAQTMGGKSRVDGFIPTAWYPGAAICDGHFLFIANVKGLGSRNPQQHKQGWNSHYHLRTVGKTTIPDGATLRAQTRQVCRRERRARMRLVRRDEQARPRKRAPRRGSPRSFSAGSTGPTD